MLATSTVLRSPPKPNWQTDELEDEWIEPSISHDHDNDDVSPAHSLSIVSNGRFDDVAPKDLLSPHISPASPTPPGTFLIREDQLAAPIMPMQLQKNKSKGLLKDFFSPLALETMFEPPSPQQQEQNKLPVPSQPDNVVHNAEPHAQEALVEHPVDEGLGEEDMEEETRPVPNVEPEGNENEEDEEFEGEDVILASDIPNLVSFDGRKPSSSYKFTFSAARSRVPTAVPQRMLHSSPLPVKNTPGLQPPPTDPRLRLFQFQYDTFTRDHLSAMVDSIAVHTPSSDSNKSKSPGSAPSRGNRPSSTPEAQDGYLRATKRLKLTPPGDLSHDAHTLGSKSRKDYVGESKNLMRMIKQTRTPSMMTNLSVKENIQPTNIEDQSTVEDRPRRVPLGDRTYISILSTLNSES
jgi:protein NUD1